VNESGMIKIQMGMNRSEMVAVFRTPCAISSCKSNYDILRVSLNILGCVHW
jgi:hypothetical protein